MLALPTTEDPIAARSLRGWFQGALDSALEERRLKLRHATTGYLAGLLSDFARSERVFDYQSGEGLRLPALAELYGRAREANNSRERDLFLRRLGDLALFLGGLFAGRLERRPVGLDYYCAMGGSAYAYLAESGSDGAEVFGELGARFTVIVPVLGDLDRRRHDLGPSRPRPALGWVRGAASTGACP